MRMLCLLLAAVLGLLLAAPVRAEEPAPAAPIVKGPLETIRFKELGGGAYYGKVEERGVYIINDDDAGAPACVILCSRQDKNEDKVAFKRVTRRFMADYKLGKYLLYTARDGSAAVLVRGELRKRQQLEQGEAFRVLQSSRVMPVFEWLSCAAGSPSCRLDGSRLIWSRTIKRRGHRDAAIEVSLNLVGGIPGLVGVHTVGEVDIVPELNRFLLLGLGVPPRNKLLQLKRYLAATPLAVAELRQEQKGKRKRVELCLVEKDAGSCYLAMKNTLRQLHEKKESRRELPEVESVPWVGASALSVPPATSAASSTPAAPRVAVASESRALEPQSAVPAVLPAPDEARRMYSERLKAL